MMARWGVAGESLPSDHPAWEIEADYLSGLCATLTYVARPDRIILGGGVMESADMHARVRRGLAAEHLDGRHRGFRGRAGPTRRRR